MAKKVKKVKIDKHILVPKHVKLSEKDKKSVLKQYNITEAELPKIPQDDSAIVSLGAKPGDIIKIIRQSPTAGESVFYRVVVNV